MSLPFMLPISASSVPALLSLFPASTHTSDSMQAADLKVLPNQLAFSDWSLILCLAWNSSLFCSPSVAGQARVFFELGECVMCQTIGYSPARCSQS